jgi:hypothetical protein
MVELSSTPKITSSYKAMTSSGRPQLDMLGTPLPAKTPINLQSRLDEIKRSN